MYISKGEWFDKNTEVQLLEDYRPQMDSGLFEGMRKGKLDQEICRFDEFIIRERYKRKI